MLLLMKQANIYSCERDLQLLRADQTSLLFSTISKDYDYICLYIMRGALHTPSHQCGECFPSIRLSAIALKRPLKAATK